ncbi:hypothetical protein E3N88_46261 [Mikania micrantha]|uniref:Uncharacterized protein n=1 Tax=Mikania micrantha TaxID=192012 RepID=A0A5N6L6X9_9ASTR|nr:hypothetical protein E3N88_46261 [Mikania micrantha]
MVVCCSRLYVSYASGDLCLCVLLSADRKDFEEAFCYGLRKSGIGRSYVISKLKKYPKFQAYSYCYTRDLASRYFGILNPITFMFVYIGTTLSDLSDITHGWHEISKTRWMFMAFCLTISGAKRGRPAPGEHREAREPDGEESGERGHLTKWKALDYEPIKKALWYGQQTGTPMDHDRILLELYPRLTGDEIRGLFAPPPWEALKGSLSKKKNRVDADKIAALTAWHRLTAKLETRFVEASFRNLLMVMRRTYGPLSQRPDGEEVLVLRVQTLSIGYYFMVFASSTFGVNNRIRNQRYQGFEDDQIKKKKAVVSSFQPSLFASFLKMAKDGFW